MDLFIIFATYGGLLLVLLTTLVLQWSGMASLGTFYLILIAPIVMVIIAYRQYVNRRLSKYHILTFQLALSYFAVAPVIFLFLFWYEGAI
jgi:hypothetical protein